MIQVEGNLAWSPLCRAKETRSQGTNGLSQEIKSRSPEPQTNTQFKDFLTSSQAYTTSKTEHNAWGKQNPANTSPTASWIRKAFFWQSLNGTQLAKAGESPTLISITYIIKFANCCCIETTGCYLYWGTMETIVTGFSVFPTSKASIIHIHNAGTCSIPGCTDSITLSPEGVTSFCSPVKHTYIQLFVLSSPTPLSFSQHFQSLSSAEALH